MNHLLNGQNDMNGEKKILDSITINIAVVTYHRWSLASSVGDKIVGSQVSTYKYSKNRQYLVKNYLVMTL